MTTITIKSGLEDLGLEDIMTVGKYKKKTVEEIYKEDSGYLVWFREERRTKNDQSNLFNKEVNTLLDMTIQESKSLKKKYKTWQELGLLDGTVSTAAIVTEPVPTVAPEFAYEGSWGAF